MKNEMYLIIDRDNRDGSILARVVDSVLKCGFHKRFDSWRDGIHKAEKEILKLVEEYDPATIIIDTDVYGMTEITDYLKERGIDKQCDLITYEEHWL